jgi:hypothetical protein
MSYEYKILWKLIADLSDGLRDEGCDYSSDGLDAMRTRVANALPASERPKWLLPYCNPAILRAPDPNPAGLSRESRRILNEAPDVSHMEPDPEFENERLVYDRGRRTIVMVSSPAKTGVFVLHRCWKCNDGERPCVAGNPRQCEYLHARND